MDKELNVKCSCEEAISTLKKFSNNDHDQYLNSKLCKLVDDYVSGMVLIGSQSLKVAEKKLDSYSYSVTDVDLVANVNDTIRLLQTLKPDQVGILKQVKRLKVSFYGIISTVLFSKGFTFDIEVAISPGSHLVLDYAMENKLQMHPLCGSISVYNADRELLESIYNAHVIFPTAKFWNNLETLHKLRDQLGGGSFGYKYGGMGRPKEYKRCELLEKIYLARRQEHIEAYGEPASHISMGEKTSKEFLEDSKISGLVRMIDHDQIHELVKMGDKPVQDLIRPDLTKAKCSKEMYDKLTPQQKIHDIQEEAMVLAIERYLTQSRHKSMYFQEAYKLALFKVMTTTTKGWFRDYAIDYWPLARSCPKDIREIADRIVDDYNDRQRKRLNELKQTDTEKYFEFYTKAYDINEVDFKEAKALYDSKHVIESYYDDFTLFTLGNRHVIFAKFEEENGRGQGCTYSIDHDFFIAVAHSENVLSNLSGISKVYFEESNDWKILCNLSWYKTVPEYEDTSKSDGESGIAVHKYEENVSKADLLLVKIALMKYEPEWTGSQDKLLDEFSGMSNEFVSLYYQIYKNHE